MSSQCSYLQKYSCKILAHLLTFLFGSFPRKCKLTTTGPWKEVPPIPLSEITILPCMAASKMEHVPLWAISSKGDVLCRLDVTVQAPAVRNLLFCHSHPLSNSHACPDLRASSVFKLHACYFDPQGTSWLHVGTDQPFKSICIGSAHQVWAIARDGSVFYRGSVSPQNPAGEFVSVIPMRRIKFL